MLTEQSTIAQVFKAIDLPETSVSAIKDLVSGLRDWGNLRNDDSRTLLHCACSCGRKDLAEFFFNQCSLALVDSERWTPLHSAASAGHTEIVRWILSHDTSLINKQNNNQATSLHYAASKGRLSIVQLLIAQGADVNVRDRNGHTPLMKAVCNSHEDIVEYLLDRPDIDLDVQENETLDNLLHIAVNNGDHDISCMIYKRAPSLAGRCNQKGKAPADLAVTSQLLSWKAIKEEMGY